MTPTLDHTPPGRGVLISPQRIGCEHPCPLPITTFADLREQFVCQSCGNYWSDIELRGGTA